MNHINIEMTNNIDDTIAHYQYSFDDNVLVKDLLAYLYKEIFKKEYDDKENLYMIFSFIMCEELKAKLSFKLNEFLDNFNFNYEKVEMKYYDGVGGGFDFEGIARMEIHEAEQNHYYTPHIHIFNPNQRKSAQKPVLISLKTFEVIEEPKLWYDTYKSKERKMMITFLKDNQETLIDAYDIMKKGKYLPYDFYLYYNGKKLKIEQRKNY